MAERAPNRPEKFALADKAGADPEEWPVDVNVRKFPVIGSNIGRGND